MHLLTPPGFGGVAVVVATSDEERSALLQCLRTRRGAPLPPLPGAVPRRALLHWDEVVRDDVLVVDRGCAGFELHLHGSPALLAAFEQRFGPFGAFAVSPAEQLLRTALSPAQLRLAIEQMTMPFDAWRAGVDALPPPARTAALAAARARSAVATALAVPTPLVLCGRQNAGKSTLFNRLLMRERALAGDVPGLTRDPVAETTCLDDYPYEIVDTAGEGPVASTLDAEAIARGRRERERGLRMLVVDGNIGPTALDRELCTAGTIVVATKADLPAAPWPNDLPCDLRLRADEPMDAAAIRRDVGRLLRQCRGLPVAGPVGGPAAWTADRLARLAD